MTNAKNITLLIYSIFMQYMKHRMQITQERREYDLSTNSVSATSDFITVTK